MTDEIYNKLSRNMIEGIMIHARLYNSTDTKDIKESMAMWAEWLKSTRGLYEKLADELIESDDGDIAMRIRKCQYEIEK